MLRIGPVIFFAGTNAKTGTELYRTLGLPRTTMLVKDLNPGAAGSSLSDFTNAQGTLYFVRGQRGCPGAFCPPSTMELWKSDGTAKGTVMIKKIAVADPRGFTANLTAVGKTVFFTANDKNGRELWKTDGTAAGTVMVKVANFDDHSRLTG